MANLGSPIVLDGSHGEGGGALFRTALAMAALTQQPLRVTSVRGGTKFPGLNAEDLTILGILAESCSAETVGASLGSFEVSFLPTRRPRAVTIESSMPPKTMLGMPSAPVVLSSALAVLARTGSYSSLTIEGETHGNGVLSYDYFAGVTLAAHRRMGLYAFPDLLKAGYGRGSHGSVSLEVEPSVLQGLDWTNRGRFIRAQAVVTVSDLDAKVSERAVQHLARLAHNVKLDLDIEENQPAAEQPGAFITLWAEFENGMGGATAMGQRGVRMEAIAQTAFDQFWQWFESKAAVDSFLSDQVLLAAVMAEGDSAFEVHKLTKRFVTIVWVIKQFLPIRITVKGQESERGLVTIKKSN
jgi:RNA 3'-terminal phosphate cyclase (ATP)